MSKYFDLIEQGVTDPETLLRSVRIGVFGYMRHGKDTFSEMLKLPFVYSSEFANEKCVWPGWGEFHFLDLQHCFDSRMNHRSTWKQRITNYNTPDKARLAEEILKDNSIYCGLRCKDELKACYEAGLFDLTLWVDRSEHLPPEPLTSCTIKESMCDIPIDNNTDLVAMKLWAGVLLETIGTGMLIPQDRTEIMKEF